MTIEQKIQTGLEGLSTQPDYVERNSGPTLAETVLENTTQNCLTYISPVYGRGRIKLTRNRQEQSTHAQKT